MILKLNQLIDLKLGLFSYDLEEHCSNFWHWVENNRLIYLTSYLDFLMSKDSIDSLNY